MEFIPTQLPEKLLRPCIRLLGEVAIAPLDLLGKKRMLMEGLSQEFDCCMWFWGLGRDVKNQIQPHVFSVIDGGVTDEIRRSFIQAYSDDVNVDPMFQVWRDTPGYPNVRITADRRKLIPDEDWYNCPHYKIYRKPFDVDHNLTMIYPVSDGVISILGMHRRTGKPPFSEMETAVLHLLFSEIEWLHREDIPKGYGQELDHLPSRLRECFMYLCSGLTRRDIARFMNLSEHTIHDYTKEIYLRYQVKSQTELIVKVYRGMN